jgi:hypothetical protein
MNEPRQLTVTFTTSAREQVGLVRRMLYGGWSYWCLLALLVSAPTLLISFARGAPVDARSALLTAAAGALGWYLIPWLYVTFKRQGTSHIQGPHPMTFSREMVVTEHAHGRGELKWTVFTKALETEEHVLLYVGSAAICVPVRALADGQLATLRGLLTSKLGVQAKVGADE